MEDGSWQYHTHGIYSILIDHYNDVSSYKNGI